MEKINVSLKVNGKNETLSVEPRTLLVHALREHLDYTGAHIQCGYCTPGMIMRSYRFLQENPNPTEEEVRFGISGNLCRCTGYQNIVKSIMAAADKLREESNIEKKEIA